MAVPSRGREELFPHAHTYNDTKSSVNSTKWAETAVAAAAAPEAAAPEAAAPEAAAPFDWFPNDDGGLMMEAGQIPDHHSPESYSKWLQRVAAALAVALRASN